MTEQELALVKLKSNISCNKTALEMSKRGMRDLQLRANEPAVYANSIFDSVEVLKELKNTQQHIAHLQRQIERDEKEIFKFKIRHGEMEF